MIECIRLTLLVATATVSAACVHRYELPQKVIKVEFIGEVTFPTGFQYRGFEVGGLSGIDYDSLSGRYVVISDDRAQYGRVRFFDLLIDLADGALDPGDVVFAGVTEILDEHGASFQPLSVDPEAIRYSPARGQLIWTSEGDANGRPFIRVMTRDGHFVDEFAPPARYLPTALAGTRENMAFESLTVSFDQRHLITATENALRQDGPAASPEQGSPARIMVLDARTGEPQAEYIYLTEAVARSPNAPGALAVNGLVELLAFDASRLLALERSYSAGAGNSIKLFLTTTRDATDVHDLDSIARRSIKPMPKELLLDFGELSLTLDNIEGMTFGQELADGSRTLVLVSDNNFNSAGGQFTQFLAFRLSLN